MNPKHEAGASSLERLRRRSALREQRLRPEPWLPACGKGLAREVQVVFSRHKRLRHQLEAFVGELLEGCHPTLEMLRRQVEADVVAWDLRTERKGYSGRSKWRRADGRRFEFDLRPPSGQAHLVAAVVPCSPNLLPTLPTLDIDRGGLISPNGSVEVSATLQISEGALSRVVFTTRGGGRPFPASVRGWRATESPDSACMPTFVARDYSVLEDPFERWLVRNAGSAPNGDPDLPLGSGGLPESVSRFHRVFGTLALGDLVFHPPSQCHEIDYDGECFISLASDAAGDDCCVRPGEDRVFWLRHDPPEAENTGSSFERFIRGMVREPRV